MASRPRLLLASVAFVALAFTTPALAQQDSAYLPGAGVNYETRLSAVEDQLRAMTGKAEQLEHIVQRLQQDILRMQSDYEARLAKLETAPPPVVVSAPPPQPAPPPASATPAPSAGSNAPVAQPKGDEPVNPATSVKGTLGALKMQGDRVTGAVANPQAPPLPETPPDYGLTPQENYDRAFGLLRQANYDEAEKAFKSFIDKNPQDKQLDNAKYWYGETFYARGKFNDAALAFADAYQQSPKGNKAPDSLLKMAMALGKLEKTQDACATLSSLKSQYPNASQSIRARADQERANLKCGKN